MKWLPCAIILACGSTASAQLSSRLDSLFNSQAANLPGFALSIEKSGEIIYRQAKGLAETGLPTPLDSLSNFRMASVSKQFTAMAILLLEKDRILSFDDPLQRFLPELPAHIGQTVLIRHLLTHSSGILDYESLIPADQSIPVLDADVLQLLAKKDSVYFSAGSRFKYSNSGYCLLALIVERAAHTSFPAFIRQRIFDPLDMKSSTVYEAGKPIPHRAFGYARDKSGRIIPSDQSITSATKGDGGIYTSLADYAKWTHALQKNTLIKLPAVLKRLRRPIERSQKGYYAAGWFYIAAQPEILFHSGSTCGFANFVVQLPGDDLSIVYFSNIADNTAPFRAIIDILRQEKIADLNEIFPLHDLTD